MDLHIKRTIPSIREAPTETPARARRSPESPWRRDGEWSRRPSAATKIMTARCVPLLSLLITAGCGKGVTPTPVADVTLAASASATPTAAPAQTSDGAAAQPLRRSRLTGPAKEVFERRGAIVARDKDGKEEELTSSGLDLLPSLSPDARTVVFLRKRSADTDLPTDIYLVRVDGGDAELLVREDPSVVVLYYELWGVHAPDFSADGKRVFFGVINGREEAVLAIDLVTRKITAIASGWDHRVIRRGTHSGCLLLLKRQYLPPPTGGWVPACSIVNSVDGSLVRSIDCTTTGALLGVEIL
jgi:hypothetical protein